MTKEFEILAETREITTKGKLKELRKKGYIPAVAYGGKHQPYHLYVKFKTLNNLIKQTSIEGTIFTLKFQDKEFPVIIKEIQRDPITDNPIHIDFQIISLKEKVEVKVPIRIVGEEVALKHTGGIIDYPVRELRIKCLPKDIPPYIELDVSNLKIGQAITVKDIPQEKFTILESPDTIIVHILSKKAVEEVPTSGEGITTSQEPEVIAKGKKEKAEGSEEKK